MNNLHGHKTQYCMPPIKSEGPHPGNAPPLYIPGRIRLPVHLGWKHTTTFRQCISISLNSLQVASVLKVLIKWGPSKMQLLAAAKCQNLSVVRISNAMTTRPPTKTRGIQLSSPIFQATSPIQMLFLITTMKSSASIQSSLHVVGMESKMIKDLQITVKTRCLCAFPFL